jgi:uncharacterized membrane-anchored protein
MNDLSNDLPRWVRLVIGRPVSRQSAVFILLVVEMFTLLAAIPLLIGVIGYLVTGGSADWTATEAICLPLALVLAGLGLWVWRAVRWMDRHHRWPVEHASGTSLGV